MIKSLPSVSNESLCELEKFVFLWHLRQNNSKVDASPLLLIILMVISPWQFLQLAKDETASKSCSVKERYMSNKTRAKDKTKQKKGEIITKINEFVSMTTIEFIVLIKIVTQF